jgi:hypothetical protein
MVSFTVIDGRRAVPPAFFTYIVKYITCTELAKPQYKRIFECKDSLFCKSDFLPDAGHNRFPGDSIPALIFKNGYAFGDKSPIRLYGGNTCDSCAFNENICIFTALFREVLRSVVHQV